MKLYVLLTITLLTIGPNAAEPLVKSSAPFSFPLTVGAVWKQSFQAKPQSFVSRSSYVGGKVVVLSWCLSGNVDKGNISVFNLAGSKIKTFPLCSREGSVQWDVASGKKVAKGVYFAKLTSGNYKKNVKIIIN